MNYGVRWDADWGAIEPPHVTTQVTFDPRGGNPYQDIAINPGDQLYPPACATPTTSRRARGSPGTWGDNGRW